MIRGATPAAFLHRAAALKRCHWCRSRLPDGATPGKGEPADDLGEWTTLAQLHMEPGAPVRATGYCICRDCAEAVRELVDRRMGVV